MVSYNYTELETALLAYTEDGSTEFAAQLPNIIKNGQERVIRELDLEIFKQTYEGTFTLSSNLISKPAELLTVTELFYIDTADNNRWKLLLPRTYGFCILYSGGTGITGALKYYDEGFSDTQIFVANAAAAAYAWRMRGNRRPAYISSSQSENWISRFAGDLLLYACLIESEGFLMAAQEGKIQEWNSEYDRRIIVARNELAPLARMEYAPAQSNTEAR
ncbi:MAG: phage adaptor protein [Candidatus Binatia bacterium]